MTHLQTVLEFLAAGDSAEEVLEEYPTLKREDVQAFWITRRRRESRCDQPGSVASCCLNFCSDLGFLFGTPARRWFASRVYQGALMKLVAGGVSFFQG